MERIIIVDIHRNRLSRTKDLLKKCFRTNEILALAYDGSLSQIPQQVGDHCSQLFKQDIHPLFVSNIDGLLSGAIERALQATQNQMHCVLSTCWPEHIVAEQISAQTDRFQLAKSLGVQTYVNLPGWDTLNSNTVRLLKHLQSFPDDNPYKVTQKYHWDGPSA